MNLSSDPDPQPGTGLQSYPTASLNPQPHEEVILCPLSDNETEGQSGHPHTVVEMAENVDGLISASASGPSLGQESPPQHFWLIGSLGLPHLSNSQLANGGEVTAAITWRGPMTFRAALLLSLINGHFNGKGNKSCIFYATAIIFQYTHLSLK